MSDYKEYIYDGSVYLFDRCVAHRWTSGTTAISKKKALSNLAYKYKKEYNYVNNVRISLDEQSLIEKGE